MSANTLQNDNATPAAGAERLGGVSETLLISLAARARGSAELAHWRGADPVAERLCRQLGVEFSRYGTSRSTLKGTVARSIWFDARCLWLLTHLTNPLFVSLASGLNTMYERVAAHAGARPFTWLDTDLPEVVALRQRLLPDDDRRRTQVLDITRADWPAGIERGAGRPIVFIAEGLLMYLDDETGPALFRRMAQAFADSAPVHVLFDWASPLMVRSARRHPSLAKIKDRSVRFRWSLRRPGDIAQFDARWRIIDTRDVTLQSGLAPATFDLLHRPFTGRQVYGCAHAAIEPPNGI